MEVILNIIVIVMLGFTIAYCLRLNARIMELKNNRKDLVELVKTFDATMINTHKSISNLKEISAHAASELKDGISKSEELVGDLSFMNETASKIADKLEKMIEMARSATSQIAILEGLNKEIEETRRKIQNDLSQLTKVSSNVIEASIISQKKAKVSKKAANNQIIGDLALTANTKAKESNNAKGADNKRMPSSTKQEREPKKSGGKISYKEASSNPKKNITNPTEGEIL